jgi:hypothetical protein
MKVDWTTDSAGVMLGFSYHDSSLAGLEWAETRYLRIRLLSRDSINTVELCDLDTVSLQQVWNGAIISEIFAWPITAVPDTVWDMSDGAWHVLLSGRSHRSDEKPAAAQIIKRRPSAFLVQVMTSYGGTIAAVCEKINVSTEASPS